jgi:hypothetical protein
MQTHTNYYINGVEAGIGAVKRSHPDQPVSKIVEAVRNRALPIRQVFTDAGVKRGTQNGAQIVNGFRDFIKAANKNYRSAYEAKNNLEPILQDLGLTLNDVSPPEESHRMDADYPDSVRSNMSTSFSGSILALLGAVGLRELLS